MAHAWRFLGLILVSLVVTLLVSPGNWITGLLVGIPLGLLGALLIMSRRAERAAYSQIEGKPGAAGAALSSLKRGWIFDEQPAAVNPRTQDVVFRAIGKPGIVLVTEGPSTRVKSLVDAERRRLTRILPNVTITVIETGKGEGQVPIAKVTKKMNKLKNELTKIEVSAVNKRICLHGQQAAHPQGHRPLQGTPRPQGIARTLISSKKSEQDTCRARQDSCRALLSSLWLQQTRARPVCG